MRKRHAARYAVSTKNLSKGTSALTVGVTDGAGNTADSAPVTVRVDNTAPGAVPLSVEGGEGWRAQNDYAAGWVNPGGGRSCADHRGALADLPPRWDRRV